MDRFTHINPNGQTYRVPVERIGEFRIDQCGSSIAMFGDMVDKLGRYEDYLTIEEAKRYASRKKEKAIRLPPDG